MESLIMIVCMLGMLWFLKKFVCMVIDLLRDIFGRR